MQERIDQKIIVALDFPSVEEALRLVESLADFKPFLKIGMQLFYLGGPNLVYQLKEQGYPIFLDLKLHDIPNTVRGAAQSLTRLGVDLMTVHCAGGSRMMEAALEGIDQGLASGAVPPRVVGITQLTSTSEQVMNEELNIAGSMEACILHYAKLAKRSGLHGVVCSPLEVEMIKENIGQDFLVVTPGIRPASSEKDDQVRVTTPKEAIRLGADYLVIGRAITRAENPRHAYQTILDEVKGANG